MKKVVPLVSMVLIIIVVIISFNNCSRGKPDDMREEIYQYGLSALETVDEFIDGKIDADVATKKLNNVYSSINSALGNKPSSNETSLSLNVYFCRHDIEDKGNGTKTLSDVIESRNEIAECIGEPLR